MRNVVKTAVLVSAIVTSGTVFAATQGTVGGTSTGDLDITVTVNDAVRISNLTDIVATFDGTNDVVETSAACVYRNGTGNYQITASGDGAGSAFTITDGVAAPIPYTVTYDDGSGASAMTSTVALTGQTGGDGTSPVCTGTGNNGTIEVTVTAASLLGAPASTYAGTLTLTVAPE